MISVEMTSVPENVRDFIIGLPKAELHVHLESTAEPGTVLKLAKQNDIEYPFETVEDIQEALDGRTHGLESFLDIHYKIFSVIKTKRDFSEITHEFLKKCRMNNVLYVEMMFDPQPLIDVGITFSDMIEGIDEGRNNGQRDFGVESNIIMCINRDHSVESAWELLDLAHPYRHLIIGLGLDSYEKDNPPRKFVDVYEAAREQGYRVTAHCDVDQENSVEHIWECIDLLKTDRIDHGINSIDDPNLVKELIRRDIVLNTCPTWRVPYSGPRDLERIKKMYEMGLKVTLNSDDPAEFNSGLMNQLLIGAVEGSGYTKGDVVQFMINAFDGSWLPQTSKDRYLEILNQYAARVR
jgi:adenosine deaminase